MPVQCRRRNDDGGDNVMKEYYKAPDITAANLEPDGWFHTGDLGLLDEDGFVFVTGELKELISTVYAFKFIEVKIDRRPSRRLDLPARPLSVSFRRESADNSGVTRRE